MQIALTYSLRIMYGTRQVNLYLVRCLVNVQNLIDVPDGFANTMLQIKRLVAPAADNRLRMACNHNDTGIRD